MGSTAGRTCGTDEALPIDAWEALYPAGVFVTIEYEVAQGDDER